jgi:hypothetical protein
MADLARFRVFYTLPTLRGPLRKIHEVVTTSPDAAVEAATLAEKPRRIAIGKVKRVKAGK